MLVSPGNCQHIGARSTQQDAFGFSDIDDIAFLAHGGVLAVVADGMGGMANGGEASHLAVRVFLQSYMAKPETETVPAALLQALHDANQAVFDLARQVGEEHVGTTLVAAVIHDDALHWVSVGDSRLYLWRDQKPTQLSEDHVYAIDLGRDVADGRISREAAETHPERLALTSYLGLDPLKVVDQNPQPLRLLVGDQLFLCSDGFYAALEQDEWASFSNSTDAQQTAEELITRVVNMNRPSQDNLTIAILRCDSVNNDEDAGKRTTAVSSCATPANDGSVLTWLAEMGRLG